MGGGPRFFGVVATVASLLLAGPAAASAASPSEPAVWGLLGCDRAAAGSVHATVCDAVRPLLALVGLAPAEPEPEPAEPGPDPRAVAVESDAAAERRLRVGEDGGTLTLTHDGRTFTLKVPPGALAETVEITMRPVTGIGEYPFSGGDPVGVQLGPDGVRLLEPAVVEISPGPELGDGMLMTSFAWHGEGEEFHLYPLVLDPGHLAMEIWHFSGYGAGGATAGEREEQRRRRPTAPQDAARQELEEPVRAARACDCRPDELETAAIEVLRRRHPELLDALRGATTDEAADAAISDALSWLRSAELYGVADELAAESEALWAAIGDAVEAAYDRAWQRCGSVETARDGLRRLFAVLRTAELIGADVALDRSRLERCIQYRVSFDSTIDEDYSSVSSSGRTSSTGTYAARVSDVAVVPASPGGVPEGAATPELVHERRAETYRGGTSPYLASRVEEALQSVDTAELRFTVELESGSAAPRRLRLSAPGDGVTVLTTSQSRNGPDEDFRTSTLTSHVLQWTFRLRELHEDAYGGSVFDGERWRHLFTFDLDASGRWSGEAFDPWVFGNSPEGGWTGESSATVTFAGGR